MPLSQENQGHAAFWVNYLIGPFSAHASSSNSAAGGNATNRVADDPVSSRRRDRLDLWRLPTICTPLGLLLKLLGRLVRLVQKLLARPVRFVPRLLIALLLQHFLLLGNLLLNLALLFGGGGLLPQTFKLPLVIGRSDCIRLLELVAPSADFRVIGVIQAPDAAFAVTSFVEILAFDLLGAFQIGASL